MLPVLCQSLKFTKGFTGLWNPQVWEHSKSSKQKPFPPSTLSPCRPSVAKLCPALDDPMDCSSPGSPVLRLPLGDEGLPFLLQCLVFYSVLSGSLRPYGLESPRLLWPDDSPGKNTGVGCHALQWTFLTQELKLHLLEFSALPRGFLTTSTTLTHTRYTADTTQPLKSFLLGGGGCYLNKLVFFFSWST